ncbi:MAG: DUF2490 domain-containing protein [Flavobacteriales bacterium]
MKKFILFTTIIALLPFSKSQAQEYNEKSLGSWLLFYGNTKLSDRWHFYIERRYRNYELLPSNEQLLIRGALFYNIDSTYYFGGGYTLISNNAPIDEVIRTYSSERRAWEQFSYHKKIKRVRWELRLRSEQRLMEMNTIKFRNRLALKATFPLNKKEIGRNTWFIDVENEIFQHFEDSPFDRYRLTASLGYQVVPQVNLQLGYANEYALDYQRQYVTFSFNYVVDLSHKFKKQKPD